MKYFRYGCLSISKNIAFTVIMVLEIAALLVTTNITIGSVNSKQVLAKPFEDFLCKEGYYFNFDGSLDTTEDYNKFYNLLSKFKSADLYSAERISYTNIVADKIFFNFAMPLQSGSWPKAAKDENGTPYVVVSPDYMKNAGDTIFVDNVGECIVSGVLTEVTYIPNIAVYADDITSLYESADYKSTIEQIKNGSQNALEFSNSAIIIAESAYNYFAEKPSLANSCFIVYNDDISKSDKEYNEKLIKQISGFYPVDDFHPIAPSFTPFSQIKADTDEYITNSYIDILPIILVVAAIVLIGLIGSAAINTVTQIKNYGIYFLCGSKWSDCLRIAFANILIILVFSGIISGVLLYASTYLNLNYLIGQVYAWNNLFISAGILLVMMILSLIIPFSIIRFTSPVEVIKSKK